MEPVFWLGLSSFGKILCLCFRVYVIFKLWSALSLALAQYANGRMTALVWKSCDPPYPTFLSPWKLLEELPTKKSLLRLYLQVEIHETLEKLNEKSCKNGQFYSNKSMNPESHHKFHIFSFQSSKWKALQDVDVGAMGRRKSNFLPFEEIFSHDRDKSAPGPPQIIPGGEQQEGILFWRGKYHFFTIPFQWFWICWYSLWCIE